MKDMDNAAKLLMSLDDVFADTVDFSLRKLGFKVDRKRIEERSVEAVARTDGGRKHYKRINNDVKKEVVVMKGAEEVRLVVALENQSYVSRIMPERCLMATAIHLDKWMRETKAGHKKRKELRKGAEWMDGIKEGDSPVPVMPLVVNFGKEPWTEAQRLSEILPCPSVLKDFMADCPTNMISLCELTVKELDEFAVGTMRAVAKCIRYADSPEILLHEMHTDPSFCSIDAEAYDVIRNVVGLGLEEPKQRKGNDMRKDVSVIEEYLFGKGEESGFQKGEVSGFQKGEESGFKRAVLTFIQNKLSGKFPRKKIIEDIQNSFGVDITKAEEYLEYAMSK